ncbi:hypothetical protein [Deminuibacter soli]|uniref:Uncharacterized protein n=1 Tax=Deminuibacter soli TaxID=2291815 RepID=A0A3E1NHG2_9BACT|nr:hypothetical protein [Deminuibacter soli]RFM27322.1 hypothetical protein DXN05_14940 [Deminuibacter soli]
MSTVNLSPLIRPGIAVAVFPFLPGSAPALRDTLIDDLCNAICNILESYPHCKVIPYATAKALESEAEDLTLACLQAGADFMITGSMRTLFGFYYLNIQLATVAGHVHLWTNTHCFENVTDLHAITMLARQITNGLWTQLHVLYMAGFRCIAQQAGVLV